MDYEIGSSDDDDMYTKDGSDCSSNSEVGSFLVMYSYLNE